MGAARAYNGSNSISLGANSGTQVSSLASITIATWVYRNLNTNYSIIYSCGSGAAAAVALYWWSDAKIYYDIRNGATTYVTTTSTVSGLLWNHVAAVKNGTTGYLIYVNGSTVPTTLTGSVATTTPSLTTTTAHLGLLNWSGTTFSSTNSGQSFTSIYGAALSTNEVQTIMYRPFEGRSLIGAWSLTANETAQNAKSEAPWAGNYYGTINNSTMGSMLTGPSRVNIGRGK